MYVSVQFSSVQSLSLVRIFVTPWTAARQASLSITKYWSLLKFMSIESGMPSNHLILCRPLLLLPSVFPSIRVFSKEAVLHIRWAKYWSFSFSISPSNEYSGLISIRMDWLDLLAVQGTLKSLLQHHSSKAWLSSIPHCFWVGCLEEVDEFEFRQNEKEPSPLLENCLSSLFLLLIPPGEAGWFSLHPVNCPDVNREKWPWTCNNVALGDLTPS